MYGEILKSLGLSKNESKIYETLLVEGESSAGQIALKSKVHRRNVYDTLQRLVERGLVFEIIGEKEHIYQAVDPRKLAEVLAEKQSALEKVLIDMEELHRTKPATESIYIYRGVEGWKNYMRDILRIKEDVYTIAGKGAWTDEKITTFTEQFIKQIHKDGIKNKILFEAGNPAKTDQIAKVLNAEYRYLPADVQTSSVVDIFGDHVVIITDLSGGIIRDDSSLTVIINQKIADSFRVWFNLLWDSTKPLPPPS